MFANIGDLTSNVISSEKNLSLNTVSESQSVREVQRFFNQSLPKLSKQLNANEPDSLKP